MGRFLVRRGLQAVVTVLLATLLVHVAVTVLPGDPVRAMFGFRRPPPEVVERIRAQYHLDEPYLVQYWLFLKDVLSFDLGQSLRGIDVNRLVATSWVPTAWLVGLALVVQTVLGVAGGVVTTLRPSSWATRIVLAAAAITMAVPVVLSAPTAYHLLVFRLHLVPVHWTAGGWQSLVLPVLTLAAVTLGTLVLFLRSELRQTLRAPYVTFATASGLSRRRIVGVHALRPALPPVISYLASNLGIVVAGVLVVEASMGVDGLGAVLFGAIQRQDRSVVVSIVMLITIVVVLLNLVADVVVAVLDPRVRLAGAGERVS